MSLKFISSLLKAPTTAQEWFYSKQIPKGLFGDVRAEISWIYDYRERTGHYPSVDAFQSRFRGVNLEAITNDPIEGALQTVVDGHIFEQLNNTIGEAREKFEGGANISDVVSFFRSSMENMQLFDSRYVDFNLRENAAALQNRYRQKALADRSSASSFNSTPWPGLNTLLGFSEPGESWILASRTSIGKSWIAVALADHLAQHGERVLIITKEMTTEKFAERITAHRYKLSYSDFKNGLLSPRALRRWREESWRSPIEGITISGMETISSSGFAQILTKIQQHRPTFLIIDGAYLIYPEGFNPRSNQVERFAMISGQIKRICLANKIKALSTIQMNRDSEDDEGSATSSIKNIYGADAWAQDADVVLMLNGKRGSNSRMLELGKGRESGVGSFMISFELDPRPNFSELRGIAQSQGSQPSQGSVNFTAV